MNCAKAIGLPILLTAVFLAAPLQAADFSAGGYAFGMLSRADTDASLSPIDVIDGDDNGFELGLGYAFSPHVAAEFSYQDFGEPRGRAGCPPEYLCITDATGQLVPFAFEDVSLSGWAGALRLSWPLSARVSLSGRLGLIAWEASARQPSLDDSGTDLFYGAGLSVDVGDDYELLLAWERVELDIDSIKVGLLTRF